MSSSSVPNKPDSFCGRRAAVNEESAELWSCVKVEAAFLDRAPPVPNKPYGLCGRKATLNMLLSEFRSCVKVEVDVLSCPSLIVLMVSVDVGNSETKLWTVN